MIHVINGLGRISGAERALLRVASAQEQRPLTLVSLGPVAEGAPVGGVPGDVEVRSVHGAFGLVGATVRLARLLRSREKDVLVCWMYRANVIGTIANHLAGRKHAVVWNIRHSLGRVERESLRVRFSMLLNRALSFSPACIVYVSQAARRQHEAIGFPGKVSVHIPNGFLAGAEPDERRRSGGPIVFGHAGRLAWEKDVENLLAAFSMARKESGLGMVLALAGPGYTLEDASFRRLLARHGIAGEAVLAFGAVSDMASFYRDIDVFVLSSLSEGFPNVLAEALLAKVPCITTDVGDAAEIVSPASGWIVPPADSAALAAAMLQAARSTAETRHAMGRIGRAEVMGRYSLAGVARRYDHLAEVLGPSC